MEQRQFILLRSAIETVHRKFYTFVCTTVDSSSCLSGLHFSSTPSVLLPVLFTGFIALEDEIFTRVRPSYNTDSVAVG